MGYEYGYDGRRSVHFDRIYAALLRVQVYDGILPTRHCCTRFVRWSVFENTTYLPVECFGCFNRSVLTYLVRYYQDCSIVFRCKFFEVTVVRQTLR